jgi:hypothetical protein
MARKRKQARIEYLPPAPDAIYSYVRDICQKLAEQRDASYASPEIVRGLSDFMLLAGKIQAKHLNRTHSIDKNHD